MSDEQEDNGEFPLAELLDLLYTEIDRTVKHGAAREWTLNVVEATVELAVTWEKKGDGGLDIKVLKLGGGLTKSNTSTMTVRVAPMMTGPQDVKI
jgi:hypothetical protein